MKGPCLQDAHPASNKISYHARLIHDTTYADIGIEIFAMSPEAARRHAREMLQKIAPLNYAAVK